MIGKVIYHLVVYTLVIQFKDTFAKHFSPHQGGNVKQVQDNGSWGQSCVGFTFGVGGITSGCLKCV